MTISHTQLIQQMHNSRAMRDLEAMTRATAAMSRRADALLPTGPARATVDQAVREALTRDGALPAAAQRPASAPLPRQTLHAALATANAGVALNLGVAHQAPGGPQAASPTTSAPARESAAPAATQPRYGGPALDAGLPTPEMVEDAVGAMFGLPPKRPGGR